MTEFADNGLRLDYISCQRGCNYLRAGRRAPSARQHRGMLREHDSTMPGMQGPYFVHKSIKNMNPMKTIGKFLLKHVLASHRSALSDNAWENDFES